LCLLLLRRYFRLSLLVLRLVLVCVLQKVRLVLVLVSLLLGSLSCCSLLPESLLSVLVPESPVLSLVAMPVLC
jgi:hypothetical protein